MTENKAGKTVFYSVTNEQIYIKVIEMERQVSKITTVFSVIAFLVSPIISVFASIMIGNAFN